MTVLFAVVNGENYFVFDKENVNTMQKHVFNGRERMGRKKYFKFWTKRRTGRTRKNYDLVLDTASFLWEVLRDFIGDERVGIGKYNNKRC
ncbi:MAG: hypothetical protein ACLRYY_06275 [Anaerobutyricum soehngenii]